MNHVEVKEDLLPLTYTKDAIFNRSCGSVAHYDFSLANTSYEARVHAVTKVASICYGNPKALGSISLFDRLQAEAAGLPSSSYEFVPVLINKRQFAEKDLKACWKYGEVIGDYLLTNLRALIADVGVEDSLNYLNTDPEEIQIIRDNFKVFLFNVDLSTRAQMVRHRCSWQELSRRYVSGKKQPFEFYISEKMKNIHDTIAYSEICIGEMVGFDDIIDICVSMYDRAIQAGVKPEEARRILPQAMMTTIWGAFQPTQLENFFTLRLDKSAQKEIRLIAESMKEAVNA